MHWIIWLVRFFIIWLFIIEPWFITHSSLGTKHWSCPPVHPDGDWGSLPSCINYGTRGNYMYNCGQSVWDGNSNAWYSGYTHSDWLDWLVQTNELFYRTVMGLLWWLILKAHVEGKTAQHLVDDHHRVAIPNAVGGHSHEWLYSWISGKNRKYF